tara:strand:+ start:2196 stop:2456 length:261 start_codon:yes stop_codon:yes gene_type:complete
VLWVAAVRAFTLFDCVFAGRTTHEALRVNPRFSFFLNRFHAPIIVVRQKKASPKRKKIKKNFVENWHGACSRPRAKKSKKKPPCGG